MRGLSLLVAVLALASVALAQGPVCTGASLGAATCSRMWFACVNTGVPLVAGVGVQFGIPQPPTAWTVANAAAPAWQPTGLTPNRINQFYRNGVAGTPMGDAAGNTIAQGMWACTLDDHFNFSPQSDYTTGALDNLYDLWGRALPNGGAYFRWPVQAVGARLQGQSWTSATIANVPLANVPASAGPATGSSVNDMIALMRPIGSAGPVTCYAALFDPCSANGCPSGQIRIGSPSVCCPTASVIFGDGSTAPTCCPSGQQPVQVPGQPTGTLKCCPTGQVATRSGGCCDSSKYVAYPNGDICCPIDNPQCRTGWVANTCTIRNPDNSLNYCCAQSWVNNDATVCCPSAPAPGTTWIRTTAPTNNPCCPSPRVNDAGYCCPSAPSGSLTWVRVASSAAGSSADNLNCCPSNQVSLVNGQKYCCPGSAVGAVATSNNNCCPSDLVSRPFGGGSGAPFCCPTSGNVITSSSDSAGNNNCCPSAQAVGSSSGSYCCPAGTQWAPGAPFAQSTGQDRWCCPAARLNNARTACCPAGCSSPTATTDGILANTCGGSFACCPGNRVASNGPYCCDANSDLWLRNAANTFVCCPATDVALPPNGASSGSRCCPVSGTPVVTSDDPCCVGTVSCRDGTTGCSSSSAACCPGTGPFRWTDSAASGTNAKCCPLNQVGTSQSGATYCCPTGSAERLYAMPDGTCCPESRFIAYNTPCCPGSTSSIPQCPGQCDRTNAFGGAFSSNCGSVNSASSATCCSNPNTREACCPNSDAFFTTTNACCPRANVARSDLAGDRLSSVCCPGTNQFLTANDNCCPSQSRLGLCGANVIEWCDSGRTRTSSNAENNRGPICCPNAGMLVADLVVYNSATCGENSGSYAVGTVCSSSANQGNCPAGDASCFCCPAANALSIGVNDARGCNNAIVCCPTAVTTGSHVVAWSSGRLTCCPVNQVPTNKRPTLPYGSNGVASDIVCCPNTGMVWVSNSWPCCEAANVVRNLANDPCLCCVPGNGPSSWTGVTCEQLVQWTNGQQGYSSGQCCIRDALVRIPGGPTRCCLSSNGYTGGYNWTTNEVCCPSAQVRLQAGNYVCCPGTTSATPNVGAFPSLDSCCPTSDTIAIPDAYRSAFSGLNRLCCPASLLRLSCNGCTANRLTGSCSGDLMHCTASCGDVGTTLTFGRYGNAWNNNWGSQCGTVTSTGQNAFGCCATATVDDVCCPHSSWATAAGSTSWVTGFSPSRNQPLEKLNTNQWFPRGCCPNRQVQNVDTGAGTATVCCPGADQWFSNWADPSLGVDARCCPVARRLTPPGYDELSPTAKGQLNSNNGVYCCPETVRAQDGTTVTPSSYTWFAPGTGGSANTLRCCPSDWVLTSGSTRLCCPNAASGFQFSGANDLQPNPQCCPANNAFAPINFPAITTRVCCPSVTTGDVYWSKTVSNGQIGSFSCCPTEPESWSYQQQSGVPAGTPTEIDALNLCCPAAGLKRTADALCCPANQVLLIDPSNTRVWTYTNKRCCPAGVDVSAASWLPSLNRDTNAPRIGWDTSSPAGSNSCCPNVNRKCSLADSTKCYCCPTTTDRVTTEGTCCPADRLVFDTKPAQPVPHCCGGEALATGTYAADYVWLPTITVFGTTVLPSNAGCCPRISVNKEGTACCVVGQCRTGAVTCETVGTERCCLPNLKNDVADFCCPSTGMVKTDNNNCCPFNNVAVYTPAGSTVPSKYCCPTPSNGTTVIRPEGGSTYQCCPSSQVLVDQGVAHCCPTAASVGAWRPVWNQNTQTVGPAGCCPTSQLNAGAGPQPAGDTCCPVSGAVNTDPTPCCVQFATVQTGTGYVACCPLDNQVVVGGVVKSCCNETRVVDDGDGEICCPDDRWNAATQTCCPADALFIISGDGGFRSCCPASEATLGGVCCLPNWWNGAEVSKDLTGDCCPTALQLNGTCCLPSEKDYRGLCCPTSSNWGLSYSPVDGSLQNRSCCLNGEDCAGFCLPVVGSTDAPVNTRDSSDVCCPTAELDCAGQCPLVSGNSTTPINTLDQFGGCCPPARRDCLGVCEGRDTNCCSLITNCTGCQQTNGCGWCGSAAGGGGARCLSGSFLGPTDFDGNQLPAGDPGQCDSESWIFASSSTIQVQQGTFGPGTDSPNLQFKRQVVVLAQNSPIVVTVQVRAPGNVPLDLFFVQDLTQSFDNDMKNVNQTIPEFLAAIKAVVPDVWFGWGSFLDKPIAPFGIYSQGAIEDYVYRTDVALAPNTEPAIIALYNTIAGTTLRGGADTPESSLEAMLGASDVAGTVSNVGWRSTASVGGTINRIMLVITDAPPHIDTDIADTIGTGDYANLGQLASWSVNNNDPLFTSAQRVTVLGGSCTSDPTESCSTLPGLGERYPSMQQVADVLSAQNVYPVFVVAPTDGTYADGTPYPADAAFDAWNTMVPLFAGSRAKVTKIEEGSTNLQAVVIEALQTITQTISLVQNTVASGPNIFMDYLYGVAGIQPSDQNPVQAAPGTVLNYTLRLVWDGSPVCDAANGITTFCVPQPSVIDLDALFPIQGIVFETGTVEVIVATPRTCGYCGDGITQTWLGEQCDPQDVTSDNVVCCSSDCFFLVNEPCDLSNLCVPRYCSADGSCQAGLDQVYCDIASAQSACAQNVCVPATGECEWSCTLDLCCDDGNPCTRDYCLNGQCYTDEEVLCNCGFQNDCLACISVNRSCAWDTENGVCVDGKNLTTVLFYNGTVVFPGEDKSDDTAAEREFRKRYAFDAASLLVLCAAGGSKSVNIGAIVGAILGAAALCLLAILALAFILFRRATGQSPLPGGFFAQDGVAFAQDSAIYDGAGGMATNPLFE